MDEYVVKLTDKQATDLRKVRRERIVRCRDCVDYFSHIGSLCCGNFSNPEDGCYVVVQPDGFCAWGERTER